MTKLTVLSAVCLDPDKPPPFGSVFLMENTVPRPLDGILEKVTGSPLSHAAIFLQADMVYEAYPPVVRKMSWYKYVTEVLPKWEAQFWTRRLGGLHVFMWEPAFELIDGQRDVMVDTAEGYLGIKYSMILNWLFKWPAERALHCSEFVSRVWAATGLIETAGARDDPGRLYRKLQEMNL